MRKFSNILIAVFLIGASLTSVTCADPIGDSYTLGISGFGGTTGGGYLNSQDAFTTHTFDGTGAEKTAGDNRFGLKGAGNVLLDEFFVSETLTVISPTQIEIKIKVVARNKATMELTNWIADGETTNGTGDPFNDNGFEIGVGLGGTDRLNVGSFLQLDAPASFTIIGTDGNSYGIGALSVTGPVDAAQLGGAPTLYLGTGNDFATYDPSGLGGVEIAGYEARYLYTIGPGIVLGDANGDGVLNSFDIAPFSLALFQPGVYAAMFPEVDPDAVLDMNDDGVFDSFDIAAFGAALGF